MIRSTSLRFSGARSRVVELAVLCGLAFSALPAATLCAQWVPNYQNYGIQRIGLFGPQQTGSAGLQTSTATFFSSPGFVAGTATRYTGVSTSNGLNAWAWNGTTSSQIGLTGAAHTGSAGFQNSRLQFQNNAGQVVGTSTRYTGVNTNNGQNAWAWNGTTTTQIGFTGAAYTGSAGRQFSDLQFQNAAGQVAGISNRYTGVNTYNGGNAWVWNGTTTTQIGLTGAGYTDSAGYQYSEPLFQNAAGQVAGSSERFTGLGAGSGQSAWVWNGTATTQIGLTGVANTRSDGFQFNRTQFQNAAGHVAGDSNRYTGVITDNGRNAWVWNGTTTTQIGLTGAGFTGSAGYQFSQSLFQNTAGQVVGTSGRITGLNTGNGLSAWAWNGTTTTQIGLTNAIHTGSSGIQTSFPQLQNEAGQVVGTSVRYTGVNTSNGQNAWAWNGTATTQIGLTSAAYTGSAGYQNSEPQFQNAAGQVAGYSDRITGARVSNGRNTWAWNGTTTALIGLTAAANTGSSGRQYSESQFQNAAGQVVGFSTRYLGVDQNNGQNAWVWNGTSTTLIGPTGESYTGSAGYQYSLPLLQNAAGQVSGISFRYTGVSTNYGQVAFYFDPTTMLSAAIIGSIRTSDNFASSTPTILTEDGFLLGYYTFFAGGVGDGEQRAFIFRPDLGFTDLDNLVSGGLTLNGWRTLQNPLFSDALNTIVGHGSVNGQTSGQSVFVMVAASVPTCVADVAGGVSGGPDGVVDGNDFIAFINAFGAGDPLADVAGGPNGGPDGIIDGNDFIAFINAFGAGC